MIVPVFQSGIIHFGDGKLGEQSSTSGESLQVVSVSGEALSSSNREAPVVAMGSPKGGF